ncbi:hypothetical protein SADUNF_Sadunf17G0115800 [Salix dunnii]|uniref:Uncharacterized protein n=1 Tax=Salix dunnii TaxID=1413687 RepID=A0A835J613_9ROSI|nr:hypothetical protein SADUNF_Sadunf17G0115800 [Salix dunnii]
MVGSFGVRKGAWTEEEDILLRKSVEKYGEGRWCQIPLKAGKGTPLINVGSQYGDDLCKPYSTTAFPPSDISEIESMWWESLLDDKEINQTNNNSCLGSSSAANQEPDKSIFAEDNPRGEIMIGDVLSEDGQNCWGDIAFDADLWNLINTEIDQHGLEGF